LAIDFKYQNIKMSLKVAKAKRSAKKGGENWEGSNKGFATDIV
jgi:hypothetical protein